MAHDVFISHSSKDRTAANAVCTALETDNIRCWVAPRDIRPGQTWAEAIAGAIEKSSVMVLIFSSNSNNSKDVLKELTLAIDSEVIVIPFRIELIEPKGAMRYYLSDVHWLDAINPPTKRQINDLVRTVKPIIGIGIDDKEKKEVKRAAGKPEVSKAIKTKIDKAVADKEQTYGDDRRQNVKKRIRWKRLKKKNKILIIVLPVIFIIALTIFSVYRFNLIDNVIQEVEIYSILESIEASSDKIKPEETIDLTLKLKSSDYSEVKWAASAGSFDDDTNKSTKWIAPKTEGSYSISVTVTSDLGQTDSNVIMVQVVEEEGVSSVGIETNKIPIANLSGTSEGFTGDKLEFDASESIDEDGTITEYIWDFGDGSDYAGSKEIVNHVYDQKGNYTVELTVVDDKGDISVVSTTVTINEKSVLEGKIVFFSNRDGDDEIYTMNPDGSGLEQLTDNAHDDGFLSFSPDSSRIAFGSDRDGAYEIYTMNPDGSGLEQLTENDSYDYVPSFSPDGSRIAFNSNRDGNCEIYTMNPDGSGVKQLTNVDLFNNNPSWSPDGSRIAFSSDRDGDFEIYTMNLDGSGVKQLTDNDHGDALPSFSPDGSRIAFSSDHDGDFEIYTMNPDGSGLEQLTDNDHGDVLPSFSPDGSRIAFSSDHDGDFEIYTMNLDGSGLEQLTDNDHNDYVTSWSK